MKMSLTSATAITECVQYGLSKLFNYLDGWKEIALALYTTLPVYRDCYSLTLMLFQYTKEFPREYKYTLGQDIRTTVSNW